MSPFTLASLGALSLVVLLAHRRGGRRLSTLVGVFFGVQVAIASGVAALVPMPFTAALYYGQAALYLHAVTLFRARMPSLPWRLFVSWPASVYFAGTLLAWPWALVGVFAHVGATVWIPFALAALGALESFVTRMEHVHVPLGDAPVDALQRVKASAHRVERPLRIVQITDPHLGSFMSERRLRTLCERAVAQSPDLIVLTGDLLTIESNHAGDALARALSPLRALEGRTFACMGNHDHEVPDVVAAALRDARVKLLVDEMATAQTPWGAVEIVGYDFVFRAREEHLAAVTARHPRTPGVVRIGLLHDPGAFRHLPAGAADLVLSGHTHGGQVGLVRLGLPHTFVSMVSPIPDHGLWGLGSMRLYVHRGTGHYGFPVRVGVPAEESVLHVHPRA